MKKQKPQPPSLEDFLAFAKEVLKDKFDNYKFSLEAKYETWLENKWRDGYDKPIVNWKLKLRTVIPYLKPVYNNQQQKGMVY